MCISLSSLQSSYYIELNTHLDFFKIFSLEFGLFKTKNLMKLKLPLISSLELKLHYKKRFCVFEITVFKVKLKNTSR